MCAQGARSLHVLCAGHELGVSIGCARALLVRAEEEPLVAFDRHGSLAATLAPIDRRTLGRRARAHNKEIEFAISSRGRETTAREPLELRDEGSAGWILSDGSAALPVGRARSLVSSLSASWLRLAARFSPAQRGRAHPGCAYFLSRATWHTTHARLTNKGFLSSQANAAESCSPRAAREPPIVVHPAPPCPVWRARERVFIYTALQWSLRTSSLLARQ